MQRVIVLILWVLAAQLWAAPASAQIVQMRSQVCYATALQAKVEKPLSISPKSPNQSEHTNSSLGSENSAATISVDAVAALSYDCNTVPTSAQYADRWVWLKLSNISDLKIMPHDWDLLVDQARFSRMVAIIVDQNGHSQQTSVRPGKVGEHRALGGMLRFPVNIAGPQVRDIYVGVQNLDDLSLLRKVEAVTPKSATWLERVWLTLIGFFVGALISAFAYNLLIYVGQRSSFQRWYLIWTVVALVYAGSWTNALSYVFPAFSGPLTVGLNYILVTALIAAGNMFFVSVIEDGILPRWLIRCCKALSILCIVMGFVAWSMWFGPALVIDKLLNAVFLVSTLCVVIGTVIAIRARSRVVWFYLVGWTPALVVFFMRVMRNFGVLPQNDVIDMLTFATLAFESGALSLAIADRFRRLGAERDSAEQARCMMEVETESFRRAALTDYLTGLGNRAAFQTRLRTLCFDAAKSPFQLLLIDVDHLKDINDRLGHDGGDFLIESVSKGLLAAVGDNGHVSRIGGDEFAILLPDIGGCVPEVHQALEQLQGTTLSHGGRFWAFSLSIGAASYPHDAVDQEVLVKNADLALYQAKQLGRRRLQCYTPALRAQLDSRNAFGLEAVQAIERGEFRLYYQPIVDLNEGYITSYEALLRWQHPLHGMMTPAVFGEVLNDRKVGLMIQNHVLEIVLTELRDNPAVLPKVAINCTAAQLEDANAARRLLMRLRAYGIAPSRLCIEVTEDFVLDRTISETVQALGVLHDAGLSVALDDFGTGYASLIHLKHLPFDTLKIDRSFTLSLFEDDGQSEAIIRAIVGLGHGLRKPVIAEGVETEFQRQRLKEMGCKFGQGYLFARPQPLEALVPDIVVKSGARSIIGGSR